MDTIMDVADGPGVLEFEYIPLPGTDPAEQGKVLAEVERYASNISTALTVQLVRPTDMARWLVRIEGPEADVTEFAADWFGEELEEVVL